MHGICCPVLRSLHYSHQTDSTNRSIIASSSSSRLTAYLIYHHCMDGQSISRWTYSTCI